MVDFEYFIKTGEVKATTKDRLLCKSLISDAKRRFEYFDILVTKENAKFVLENTYEAMREIADAILAIEGYKSYSHEASILFLSKRGFINESEQNKFDQLRKIRNKSKYYGTDVDEIDAKDSIALAKRIIEQLGRILNEKLGA